jgi:uncharacterized repeat protein (TIGR01451 family)
MLRHLFIFVVMLLMTLAATLGDQPLMIKGSASEISPWGWVSRTPHYMQTVPGGADLSINKTALPDLAEIGSALTYTITITNSGPSDATDVVLVDALPVEVAFNTVQTSQGDCSQSILIIICNLNSLDALAIATVTVVVTPTQAATLINRAVVTSNDTEDPDPENNSATVNTLVQPSTAPISVNIYLPILLKFPGLQ